MRRKQILIVEDNRLEREMLAGILSEQYRLLEAENGQEALEVLEQHGEEISLILLDLMMPVMDGFAFMDRIKQDPDLTLIPVIVITQNDSEEDEIAALTHGATDFMSKPYRPQVLRHRIASIISLRENAVMAHQFKYDSLTGLCGKGYFYQKARERLRDNPDRQYYIVCCNVVNFKLYNDTFGMETGNELLRLVAGFMRQRAGEEGICGRLRADRFACLTACDVDKMYSCFSGVESEVKQSDRMKGVVLQWGVYEVVDRTIPVELMCDRVLLAVDSIKGQYNQNVAVYDDAMRGRLLREQAITGAMESALEAGQFTLYLQPKYNILDGRMSGEEALVRWTHPDLGPLSPGEFIPLFEKNGFITRMDKYVWEQGCILLRRWIDEGLDPAPLSVNVSRVDVFQVNLVNEFKGLIEKYHLDPALLHLEITESAYTENPAKIIRTVDRLRKLGFIVELDDFGSGYSSLNILDQMKMDVLKLDMKFIQSEMSKPPEQGILRSIIAMAHWMNLTVVAEGVETREQVERLRAIDCDAVQGYYFARPMPVSEFEVLMETQQNRVPVPVEVPKAENQPEKQGLLVVDDTSKSRFLIQKALKGRYTVYGAKDTVEALLCLEHHGQELASVILSLTLPDNGAEKVLLALRSSPQTRELPVLAMSSWKRGLTQKDYEMDVDDIAFKPRDEVCMNCLCRRVDWLRTLADTQERERNLRDEANRDFLTGLLNRRGLEEAYEALKKEDFPLCAYMFDLDNLKRVNDKHGHEGGDLMICTFTDMLRAYTRDGDILCRYGGDEFVVLLRRMEQDETILNKGEMLCSRFQTFGLPDQIWNACSAGAARSLEPGEALTDLLERADLALYRAKRDHKGGCCLWDEKVDTIQSAGRQRPAAPVK